MADNEKRMIDKTYEVIHAIHIGDKEVVFGEAEAGEPRYMCCYHQQNWLLEQSTEAKGSDDYLEIMELFCQRVQGQIEQVRAVQIPDMGIITAAMCYPDNRENDINGKVIAINAETLRHEYRSADRQLHLVSGGFGANANSRGNAVFCYNLHTGKHTRFERYDVQGEIRPEHMPQWAKVKLEALIKQQQRKKSGKDER